MVSYQFTRIETIEPTVIVVARHDVLCWRSPGFLIDECGLSLIENEVW
jgi:hypothetical protein